jgi:hypothetical protein
LLALLRDEEKHFAEGKLNPRDLATADAGEARELPKGVTPPQFAGWTAVARVLLNLDETITKE